MDWLLPHPYLRNSGPSLRKKRSHPKLLICISFLFFFPLFCIPGGGEIWRIEVHFSKPRVETHDEVTKTASWLFSFFFLHLLGQPHTLNFLSFLRLSGCIIYSPISMCPHFYLSGRSMTSPICLPFTKSGRSSFNLAQSDFLLGHPRWHWLCFLRNIYFNQCGLVKLRTTVSPLL